MSYGYSQREETLPCNASSNCWSPNPERPRYSCYISIINILWNDFFTFLWQPVLRNVSFGRQVHVLDFHIDENQWQICKYNQPCEWSSFHDDVIKWKHFPPYRPFVQGIHRSPVNSPHKGQCRGALMFSLICACINGWESNREAGDLWRHRTYYDVTVM